VESICRVFMRHAADMDLRELLDLVNEIAPSNEELAHLMP
jgi:hypothetical protein